MNKRLYLILISIITAICIIGGSVYHLFGWFFASTIRTDGQGRISYDENHNAFDSIKIEASVLDITIETGSEYHVFYDCVSYLAPEITTKDDTLVIEQPSVPKLNSGNNHCELVITIPADVMLQSIDIQADVGNIFLDTVTSEKATLLADVGNIEADSCSFSYADAEADVGAVTFRDCTLEICEFSADVGAIAIKNCTFSDLELSGDLGDITVQSAYDLSDYEMAFSVDAGNLKVNGTDYKRRYNQNGTSGKRIHIENELGNVDVRYGE